MTIKRRKPLARGAPPQRSGPVQKNPREDVIEVAKRELRRAIRLHRRASDADMAMRAVMKCEADLIHAVREHDALNIAAHRAAILDTVAERVAAEMRLTVSDHVSGMSEAPHGEYLSRMRVLALIDAMRAEP